MKISDKLKENRWSPYAVGSLIGVLAWVVFGAFGETLGVSTTFISLLFFIEQAIAPEHATQLSLFKDFIKGAALINWQFAFVLGILAGSFLAAYLARSFNRSFVPRIWSNCFGKSPLNRFLGAFFGGMLLMFGARLAGGCTSGHGISGGLMLALSGWLFVIAAFAAGIPFSFWFYRNQSGKGGQ